MGCAREPCNVSRAEPALASSAIFDLSCAATDLTSVTLSGPCATGDASPSNYLSGQGVEVSSPTPGTCHVALTFATGFTYSTDVTFTSMSATVYGCNGGTGAESYIGPTQVTFMVHNPSATCVESELDSGTASADASPPVATSSAPITGVERASPPGRGSDICLPFAATTYPLPKVPVEARNRSTPPSRHKQPADRWPSRARSLASRTHRGQRQ
jgi:hypothetical protein